MPRVPDAAEPAPRPHPRLTACTAATAPPPWQALPPPRAELEIVVVIPVRSEAARLPATLAALAAQVDDDGRPLPPGRFEILVLANNCTDDSAGIVRRFAAEHPRLNLQVAEVTFSGDQANVGHARAGLMDEACRRLHAVGRPDGIIASTDGDTRVAPDWLAAIRHEIRQGADAVGGRIDMDDDRALPDGPTRLARRDAIYQQLRCRLEHCLDPEPADPWPRHHQHFGASLAITVAAYLQVGGLPDKPYLEDEALYQALLAHDLKLRHSDRVRVITSNRRSGRVAVGLSWQLREWSALAEGDADADPAVEDPARLARDLDARRRLRDCWSACRVAEVGGASTVRDLATLAADLQVPPDWLQARVAASPTFGRLWQEVAERRPADEAVPRLPMREAIDRLRAMLAAAGEVSDARTGPADTARDASR